MYNNAIKFSHLHILTIFREPAQQLANMAEWSGIGGLDESQSVVSIARQKLLKDSMDAYFKVELRRQMNEALTIHKACSNGIDKMFDKMDQVGED